MKTTWDYTDLAAMYVKRAKYSQDAIDKMVAFASLDEQSQACDVGAGVAHLTLNLLEKGVEVVAVEPNDAMRALGRERTEQYGDQVEWFEGIAEHTGQQDDRFDIVTFGSSFNVCDRTEALKEVRRIAKPQGWFAAMWNHRDLDDPIQTEIENIIKQNIPGYDYGSRREDQSEFLEQSGQFQRIEVVEGKVLHKQSIEDCVEAWRSHATLARQAKDDFEKVVNAIDAYLQGLGQTHIDVPYTTRMWVAQLK